MEDIRDGLVVQILRHERGHNVHDEASNERPESLANAEGTIDNLVEAL
jgi:hypothetical protein